MNVFFFMLKRLRQRGIKCKLWSEFAHVLVCLYVSLVVNSYKQTYTTTSGGRLADFDGLLNHRASTCRALKRAHLLGLAGSVADKLDPIDGAQGKDKGKM